MSDTLIALVAASAQGAVARAADQDLKDRARAAFKAARANGIVTDEDTQFKGGLAALLHATEGAEREAIEQEIRGLGRVSSLMAALQAGLPVNMEEMEPIPAATIGLTTIWQETARNDRSETP